MKEYSWISFKFDLRRLPWWLWVNLGECASKCDHVKRVPLPPKLQQDLHKVYLAKGAHATTAIEGNTLSAEEVKDIVENRANIPMSKKYLEQEVRNILDACKDIANRISNDQSGNITKDFICNLNKLVLNDVPCEDGAVGGVVRRSEVVVGNVYRGPNAPDVPELLDEFCKWINSSDFESEQSPVVFSIIKAIVAHLYIAWIHPFGDGNGRTARLLEFAILLNSGIPSSTAHLLSNHYNATRDAPEGYYKQLDKASKTGEVVGFFSYAIQGFLDGLKEHLNVIIDRVIYVTWKDFLYESFKTKGLTAPLRRQRDVLLELSKHPEGLLKSEVEDSTAKFYKQKTTKTLTRDLNKLERIGFLVQQEGKYKARIEQILMFRPFSVV